MLNVWKVTIGNCDDDDSLVGITLGAMRIFNFGRSPCVVDKNAAERG